MQCMNKNNFFNYGIFVLNIISKKDWAVSDSMKKYTLTFEFFNAFFYTFQILRNLQTI